MTIPHQQIEKLVHEGRFLEAWSRTEILLKENDDLRLKQLLALSMAKSGAPKAAMDMLEPVYRQHPGDPETSGILGSIYKELFKETKNSKYAVLSRDTYLNNYTLTGNYYTGINAASMYAISGNLSKAKEIARGLIASLDERSTNVWELATLGEAFLLTREKDKAIGLYHRCRNLLGSDWGKISSIYNQLWLLNHYISVSSQVMTSFSPPSVVSFVGHMIDHPGRELRRFPPSIDGDIKKALAGAIQSINARIGYCSLACGGDILFAEAMAESGGEVNLFLPFSEEDFLRTSVAFAGQEWVKRYEALKEKFPPRYVTREAYGESNELFSFQSLVIMGSTLQRATLLHSTPYLLTVYADVDVVKKVGGTYDTLKFWPAEGKRININPQNFMHAAAPEPDRAGIPLQATTRTSETKNRHVRYLVAINTTDASPEQQNKLQYHLDKKLREMAIPGSDRTGSPLLFAFKTTEEAAALAWGIHKLPGLSAIVKISLHAGPVVSEEGAASVSGPAADVARAINGFSVAGKIYSSYQFASVLALQENKYAVEYAGILSVGEDSLAVYQVNRHADAFDLV